MSFTVVVVSASLKKGVLSPKRSWKIFFKTFTSPFIIELDITSEEEVDNVLESNFCFFLHKSYFFYDSVPLLKLENIPSESAIQKVNAFFRDQGYESINLLKF